MGVVIKAYEDMDFNHEDGEVYFDEISVTYNQSPDCTEDQDGEVQSLTLSTRNNGMSRFINIKTDNWSVDGVDELRSIFEDFSRRAGIKFKDIKKHGEQTS